MGMAVREKGTVRRSPFPHGLSRPRGWVAGPPLQPMGSENAQGIRHRRAAQLLLIRLRAPPNLPAAWPRGRLTVRRNWISSSPPSPPSAMAPEASVLPQPPAPLLSSLAAWGALVAAALFSPPLPFPPPPRAPGSAQQRRANPRPYRELGLHSTALQSASANQAARLPLSPLAPAESAPAAGRAQRRAQSPMSGAGSAPLTPQVGCAPSSRLTWCQVR